MNVLIADPSDNAVIDYLKEQKIDVDYQPRITPEELLTSIPSFDALMVRSRTKVTAEVINKGMKLKIVARIGSGYDNIDIDACKTRNIIVVNAPDANSVAVAELTLGLMLALLRQLPLAFSSMRQGLWLKNELWGAELSGKIVGIVGFGHVGKKVGKLVTVFGAKTFVFSRNYQTALLPDLFKNSDIITLHLALTKETKGSISKDLLSLMKPSSYLINIARGEIVDEKALYEILSNKKIVGAALDVYWNEPLSPDSPWRKLDNVILTPHIGAATREALAKASLTVAEDIVRVAKGEKPKNSV